MKKIITIIALCFGTSVMACAAVPAEPPKADVTVKVKRVCIKVWDAKKQAEVEKCKDIKIREKHQGTSIPPK